MGGNPFSSIRGMRQSVISGIMYNARGACLASAVLSDEVRPGVVIMQTGSWFNPDATGALDLQGNPNMLTRDAGASRLSQAPTAQTALVRIRLHRTS